MLRAAAEKQQRDGAHLSNAAASTRASPDRAGRPGDRILPPRLTVAICRNAPRAVEQGER
jgi:hypothetical protein